MKEEVIRLVSDTVKRAGSTFSEDKKNAYRLAIAEETDERAKWVLETLLENGLIAEQGQHPLCDDTGIPHLFLEIGKGRALSGEMLEAIEEGVAAGLHELPGRPMAIMGDDRQRLDQSGGLDLAPEHLAPAPPLLKLVDEDVLRLHVLMFGGGPAIRGKTYRVFHKHSVETILDEIVSWATESVAQLGCTPATLAIGIGRSHFEAASLMLESQVYGRYEHQSDLERDITRRVNESHVGALGLGGNHALLGTFLTVGPQRASGVRIVCMRPCCCFEPRHAVCDLSKLAQA